MSTVDYTPRRAGSSNEKAWIKRGRNLAGACGGYGQYVTVTHLVSSLDLSSFAESMPAVYRQTYSEAEIRGHAEIVAKRGTADVHLESCPDSGNASRGESGSLLTLRSPDQTQCVCIIADDQAGLISAISQVMLSHDLDVVKAQMFSRSKPGDGAGALAGVGELEAVDFIWFRADRADPDNPVVVDLATLKGELKHALVGLGRSMYAVNDELGSNVRQSAPEGSRRPPKVYFDLRRAVLVVESTDRRGLLLAITLAVFREGMVIQGSTVTTQDGVALDEFEVTESDGRLLSDEQRVKLVQRVRESVL